MKLGKILIAVTAAALISTSAAYAAPVAGPAPGSESGQHKSDMHKGSDEKGKARHFKQRFVEFEKEPLKVLQERKEKVRSLEKDGRITSEKAGEINNEIESRIKAVNEFNKLSPEQKKVKTVNDMKAIMDKKVKEGKLSREKADEILKDYGERVSKWDGNGCPGFMLKIHVKR